PATGGKPHREYVQRGEQKEGHRYRIRQRELQGQPPARQPQPEPNVPHRESSRSSKSRYSPPRRPGLQRQQPRQHENGNKDNAPVEQPHEPVLVVVHAPSK